MDAVETQRFDEFRHVTLAHERLVRAVLLPISSATRASTHSLC